jgi:hypothetical protein
MSADAYTMDDLAAINLDMVTQSVQRSMRCHTREEAEDAVQNAILRTMGRLEKLTRRGRLDGFIVHAAKEMVLKHRRLRESGNLSLEALEEADPSDERGAKSIAISEDDLDSALMISAAANDPILAQRMALAATGAAPRIMPTGVYCALGQYPDGVVEEVRRLVGEGEMTLKEIAESTHMSERYVIDIRGRVCRVAPSMQGWTDQRILDALRRWAQRCGRPPSYEECDQDPRLPCVSTLTCRFGTYRDALRAAGLKSKREGQRLRPWTDSELAEALQKFFEDHGRYPGSADLRHGGPALPSECTVQRRLGTVNSEKLGKRVRRMLARSTDPSASEIAEAFRRFRLKHGRWPGVGDLWRGQLDISLRLTQIERRFGCRPGNELIDKIQAVA